ncbi:unnamed protein product [Cunninghamella blakesleeana]
MNPYYNINNNNINININNELSSWFEQEEAFLNQFHPEQHIETISPHLLSRSQPNSFSGNVNYGAVTNPLHLQFTD